ncbi:tyrosine-type recombinase/integrase [Methylocapsa sp. D3K7]|uniref:tyrosine-type recombinase/integrase n=1 Tax=Methylocapsa sp. D3K7 TaxID=3041435 RepID=UPI00244EAD10|nr:tyrosine-type recombinase/integrase [Methylocapsa sp. D3K7]WGJ16127.1 tyrosine-type recombinase/integrase [Methylocapsa sp. D3K7]
MPRPRPPHLHKERTRHGKIVWFVRIDHGPRVRIKEEYGTPEFEAAYHAAIAGEPTPKKAGEKTGTLAWLISRYRDSAAWANLSQATKKQRENIFLNIIKLAGEEPFVKITRKTIAAARDRRKDTPFAANNFLKTMRGLFRWALEAGFVDSDPTEGVKGRVPSTKGFHPWSEEEILKFETRWPIGTRERLAFGVLLYTGFRLGDAARLGRQHVRNGVIVVNTEKNGTKVEIPILPELAEIIEGSKTGDLAFVATPIGKPMAKQSFGNWFREACKAAGVPGSAHGLRKAAATRAADDGATEAALEAIFGWKGGKMASLYTKNANRARLARENMGKLSSGRKANIYSLTQVSGAGKNGKS